MHHIVPRKPRSKEYRRRERLKLVYGLTLEQYQTMLEKQHGVCALCGQPETRQQYGVLDPLAVDHDHKTGKIRGLLCRKCNLALGVFEEAFERYTSYLDQYK